MKWIGSRLSDPLDSKYPWTFKITNSEFADKSDADVPFPSAATHYMSFFPYVVFSVVGLTLDALQQVLSLD